MRFEQLIPAFFSPRDAAERVTSDDVDAEYRDEFGLLAPIPASHGQRRAPAEGFFSGPEIGERLPDFELPSADGKTIDFHTNRAGKKAAVVFYRSAVWCPLCMTQLVELQQSRPKFEEAGIELYAISYDEVDALADFALHHGITYPLLSDVGSKVIDRFGIRNHFVTRDQVPYYGIPFPGTYLVDEEGKVANKFFHRNLAQRESAESIIDAALGRIVLGDDEPHAEAGEDDISITAAYHGGDGTMKAGVMRQVVVRFDLAPGVHIYGEPVPSGMVAAKITVRGPEGLHAGETIAPPTHAHAQPGLDMELPVWEGQVDFLVPVHVDYRIASIVDEIQRETIPLEVEVEYQACDEQRCRIPRRETISLSVPVAPHVGNSLAGELAGTVTTTMDSRRFMLRMLLRGWRQSPLRGAWYLLKLLFEIRRGPTGRRRRSS